jgi:hypothetical protein
MAVECFERARIQIGQRAATFVKKLPHVRRRPHVSHRTGVRVAFPFECVSKPIDV